MTSKERAALRAKANPLEPIIQIGKEGISENLLTQIDDTLDNRELIKIRVHLESAPESPKELAQKLSEPLGAEVIQVIGGIIVLYREADEERIAEKKKKRGSGMEQILQQFCFEGKPVSCKPFGTGHINRTFS